MDHYGIPRRGVGVGPHESGEFRRDAHRSYPKRGPAGSRLPAFGEEVAQGYQSS